MDQHFIKGSVNLYSVIVFLDVCQDFLLDIGNQFFRLYFSKEVCHVQIYDIILIQMIAIIWFLCNFQIREQIPRIAASIIIATQHLRRVGFPETAGPADTNQILRSTDCRVNQTDQPGFINIFPIDDSFESFISGIQICAHVSVLL